MTYPHAQTATATAAKPDPRADPCGECKHFRSWHEGNAPKRPWESAPACTAWMPEGRCRCGGWEPKRTNPPPALGPTPTAGRTCQPCEHGDHAGCIDPEKCVCECAPC